MNRTEAHTIDEYIAAFPKNVQNLLKDVRRTIRKAAPESEEAISYQIPAFRFHGRLVYFAAWKNHIGIYPLPKGDVAFRKELLPYKTGKATVRFPIDKPLPLKLIGRIVKYRVEENLKRNKSARGKKS
jgi:uncharacterized protein YdhG (YjbR/CyaY superfamily)